MSRRQLLGGAAILAVVATVLWYVVVAPSRGSAVEPDASVRVVLSATAAGSGTWVRYLVTVKNLADGDFSGDVLLLDRDLDSESAAPAAPPLTSLSRNPRIPTVPAVAGDSACRGPATRRWSSTSSTAARSTGPRRERSATSSRSAARWCWPGAASGSGRSPRCPPSCSRSGPAQPPASRSPRWPP